MKQSHKSISKVKSTYKSFYFSSLFLGSASVFCINAYATTQDPYSYTYTKIDGRYAMGDEKLDKTDSSAKETIVLHEVDQNFYLTPTSASGVPPKEQSWTELNGEYFGTTETDNKNHLEPHFKQDNLNLVTFHIHNGDSLNQDSSLNLIGISSKSGRIIFEDPIAHVKTEYFGVYGNIDARKVATMELTGYAANTAGNQLKPNEHYTRKLAQFSDLIMNGVSFDLSSVSARNMILKNKSSGEICQLTVSKLNVGSMNEGSSKIGIKLLSADEITISSSWAQEPSILAYSYFYNDDGTNNSLGTRANISVGQNSAIVYGYQTSSYMKGVLEDIKNAGGLSENGIKAMLYLNHDFTFNIGANAGVTIDGNEAAPATQKDTLKIGANSAIVLGKTITESSMLKDENSGWTAPAITFKNPGTVTYTDSSKIILDSADIKVGSRFKIFDNARSVNASGSGQNLKVESANGNFKTYIYHTNTSGITGQDQSKNSDPNDKDQEHNGITAPVVQTFTEGDYFNLSKPLYQTLQNTLNNKNSTGPGARFLTAAAGETFTGASEIEVAGRLHAYSGVYQSSLEGLNAADRAIDYRIGLDESYARAYGLWILPYYERYEASSMKTEKTRYGLNTELTGFSIGSDFCIQDRYRLGLMAHMGTARTKGKDIAKHTKGKNRYWGLGVYGSAFEKSYAIDGELIYTHIDNTADSSISLMSYHELNTKTKGNMFRAGVNASLIYDFGSYRVLPYTGIKYTKLKLKNSEVYADRVKIAEIHSGNLSAVTIPLGVKLNLIKKSGDWSIMPEAKAGVNFNLGKTDAKIRTTFTGADAADMKAQIMDRFTYGLSLGAKFTYASDFELSLGGSYERSSKTDLYGLGLEGVYRF